MKPLILMCCDRLEAAITDETDSEKFFDMCVQEKLTIIYEKENKDFDDLLNKLEVYVDYNNVEQVKKCVVKLLRLLSKNRKSLIKTLKGLNI